MPECIHGFEEGFCDICYPRAAPEPVRAARAAASKRNAAQATITRTENRRAAAAPPVLLSAQRVYHFTHIRNLEAIASEGALRSDATPEVDVSSATTRELRNTTEVPGGGTVGERVPFHMSPEASRWAEVRDGAAGSHWSDAAREASPLEFVVLVTDASEIGPDVVLADGDAAATLTRFAQGMDAGTLLLRRLRSDDPDLHDPEVLAPSPFPFESVVLIGVPNEPMRNRVKKLLASVGNHQPKVAVYPPWFQPT